MQSIALWLVSTHSLTATSTATTISRPIASGRCTIAALNDYVLKNSEAQA